MAASWVSRTSGRSRAIRSPRTPSAGLGSSAQAEERQRLVGARRPGCVRRSGAAFEEPNASAYAATCSSRLGASRPVQEEELGAEQADARDVGQVDAGQVGGRADVDHQVDRVPVARYGPGPCPAASRSAFGGRAGPYAGDLRLADAGAYLAGRAVDRHLDAVRDAAARRAQPTTAGRPSERARIAVWLVGPPRSVTRASTLSGSRVGGVGRARGRRRPARTGGPGRVRPASAGRARRRSPGCARSSRSAARSAR